MIKDPLARLLIEARKIIAADCSARVSHEDFLQRSAIALKKHRDTISKENKKP